MYAKSLLKDVDVDQLAEAVLTILEKVGALYQSKEILTAIENVGARVDYSRQVATFPREMVNGFLVALRKETPAASGQDDGHRKFSAPGPGGLFHNLSQYYYDAEKMERRIGNQDDYIRMIKLGDVVHPKQGVGHCLLLSDCPAPIEPLMVTLLQYEYAHRARGAYVQDVRQVDYLMEMEEVCGIPDFHWLANIGFSSPLRLGKDIADRWVYAMKLGRPISLYVMTACGAGTPVTGAGCVALASAELLANCIAGRALNPKGRIGCGVWISTMDMRTGETSYMAFDAMIRNFTVREFMQRWAGIPVSTGGGEYTPAKTPGLFAAMEKAYSAMIVAAFTGSHAGVGIGHLDGGLVISPEQFLLDREMANALRHLNPIEITPETISLDAIQEVGHAEKTNYMETDNTLQHYRSALWIPELLERLGWTGLKTEERVLGRARQKVNDLVASYKKPDVDEEKLAKMRQIVARARKELCKES